MDVAIETKNLTRVFGKVTAVNDVALRVERGTFYGFLGPNGAGKSTTIKMLTGLLAPSAGQMTILGLDPELAHQGLEIKRRIGVVPEDLALFDNLTAREYLTFVGRMYELDRGVVDSRTEELLSPDESRARSGQTHRGVFPRHEEKARTGRRIASQSRVAVLG